MAKENPLLLFGTILCVVAGSFLFLEFSEPGASGHIEVPDCYATGRGSSAEDSAFGRVEVSGGWTVTSYMDVNEKVYEGKKVEVFDSEGNSIGFYKSDFLERIKTEGVGKGDGVRNTGESLHYDYVVDDGKTYYLSNASLGAYGNEIVPWTGAKPSIAVDPPFPPGTRVVFTDLGIDSRHNPGWVNDLLKNTTFYADDMFSGPSGKRIDVYVGLQKTKETDDSAESLLMRGVEIKIYWPASCVIEKSNETADTRIHERRHVRHRA